MKHKTSELTGALLDAAVAKADGVPGLELYEGRSWCSVAREGKTTIPILIDKYSSDWAHGGPIIEREHLRVEWHSDGGGFWRSVRPAVAIGDWPISKNGSTALEAAMRAYVASKLGDEVELP